MRIRCCPYRSEGLRHFAAQFSWAAKSMPVLLAVTTTFVGLQFVLIAQASIKASHFLQFFGRASA
jgi:hypothetical protein